MLDVSVGTELRDAVWEVRDAYTARTEVQWVCETVLRGVSAGSNGEVRGVHPYGRGGVPRARCGAAPAPVAGGAGRQSASCGAPGHAGGRDGGAERGGGGTEATRGSGTDGGDVLARAPGCEGRSGRWTDGRVGVPARWSWALGGGKSGGWTAAEFGARRGSAGAQSKCPAFAGPPAGSWCGTPSSTVGVGSPRGGSQGLADEATLEPPSRRCDLWQYVVG